MPSQIRSEIVHFRILLPKHIQAENGLRTTYDLCCQHAEIKHDIETTLLNFGLHSGNCFCDALSNSITVGRSKSNDKVQAAARTHRPLAAAASYQAKIIQCENITSEAGCGYLFFVITSRTQVFKTYQSEIAVGQQHIYTTRNVHSAIQRVTSSLSPLQIRSRCKMLARAASLIAAVLFSVKYPRVSFVFYFVLTFTAVLSTSFQTVHDCSLSNPPKSMVNLTLLLDSECPLSRRHLATAPAGPLAPKRRPPPPPPPSAPHPARRRRRPSPPRPVTRFRCRSWEPGRGIRAGGAGCGRAGAGS